MPFNRLPVDPRAGLGLVAFNQSCTIQVNTPTRDSVGGSVAAWADLAGHIALPCNFYQPTGKAGGQEQRAPDGTFLDGYWECTLQASYPEITEAMRLVVNGQAYNIKQAAVDGAGLFTVLLAELIR